MRLRTLLQNIILSLSLTSAVVAPTVYAAEITVAAQALPQKSYGTFIAKIAEDTSARLALLADKKTYDEIGAATQMALETSFSNMAYATIYGVQKDPAGHVVGRFNKDTSGKATAVSDARVRNILSVCETLAAYLHQFETSHQATDITNRLYDIIGHPRSPADDYTEETNFSYLQRIMLMRIILGYFKKLHPSLEDTVVSESLKSKMTYGDFSPKLPDASKNVEFYWAKTNAAMPVINAEIHKFYFHKDSPVALVGKISSNLSFPEMQGILRKNPKLLKSDEFWSEAFPQVKSPEAYLSFAALCFHNFEKLYCARNALATHTAFIDKIHAAFKEPFADGLVGELYMASENHELAMALFNKPGTIVSQEIQCQMNNAAQCSGLGFNSVSGRAYLEKRISAGDKHAQMLMNLAARYGQLGFTDESGKTYLENRINEGDSHAQKMLNKAALKGEKTLKS